VSVLTERLPRRATRIAAVTALGDMFTPGRITARAVRLVVGILLVYWLWRALYSGTAESAGLSRGQAVDFAILAVLAIQINEADRWIARDTVYQHVGMGTIVYWFLRPMRAQRYYLYRALGDRAYGFVWATAGFVVCLLGGLLTGPASVTCAAAFAMTFVLGQSVLYYLALLLDQMCFWMVKNGSVASILMFIQSLLSGAFAPLWFFPHWFQILGDLLPFQATLNVPLSFYVGRMPLHDLPGQIAVQAAWILILALATRLMWRGASDKIQSQGG
jgi:ABC-2 type transport system permease protein